MFIDTTALAEAKSDAAMLACGCAICMGKSTIANNASFSLSSPPTLGTISAAVHSDIAAQFTGTITPGEEQDVFSLSVVAGQTYSVALRGAGPDGLQDPLLAVFNEAGTLLNFDDDGGAGITSLLTFTATESGTYFLTAQSFAPGDAGAYTLDIWEKPAADDVPDTFAGAVEIGAGTTFGFIDTSNDVDTYKVYLEAGKFYTFQLAAGADYDTDPDAVPAGEVDTILALYGPDGAPIGFNDDISYPTDISSGFSFLAQTSGYYYLDVLGYEDQTGGYTLDVAQIDPAEVDPLDSINWENADNIPTVLVDGVPTAYVYFGDSDENFGETGDDGETPMVTIDWNSFEKQQVMVALQEYTRILGINYVVTEDSSIATFRLLKTESEDYGAYFYPQDPAYGDGKGIGVFNVLSGGWNLEGQASLLKGGYSFAVMLHEFGHAHGLAHPHDNGGGSDVMLGVTGVDSLGLYNLNQGVYTVMSYNDAWQLHPDGPTPFTRANIDSGWSGTLSAFDIAQLQQRYGVIDRGLGNSVYMLGDANDFGTYYQTIWDTGGTDEIRYDGARAAQIDLTAATLDYSPTGGGVVSFVDEIWGGYTIANGVVIENATGGSGADILLGNAANNVLRGNAGDDVLMGRDGDDTLYGGAGKDRLDGGAGNDRILYSADDISVVGGAGIDTLVLIGAAPVDLRNASSQVTGKAVSGFENVDASSATVAVKIIGSDEGNLIKGGSGSDNLSGQGGEDYIFGGAGNDTIMGGLGSDRLYGGEGNDKIFYDHSDYEVYGGSGNDTLMVSRGLTVNLANTETSQVADKTVFGFENVDASEATAVVKLFGSQTKNILIGGSAADILRGGGGGDVLTGGGGADRFVFESLASAANGRTTITDLSAGDKIDLSGIDAITGGADNAFSWIGASAFSGVAGQLRAYSIGSDGYLIEGDVNGDGIGDFSIQSTASVNASYFIL